MAPAKFKKSDVVFFNDTRLGAFTNEAAYPVRLEDTTWPTVTHYLLAKQFRLDPEQVRKAASVRDVRVLAFRNEKARVGAWSKYADEFLFEALRAKFSQHLVLEALLAGTGNTNLVHVPRRRWEPAAYDDSGNTLGRLLMKVRREIGTPIRDRMPDIRRRAARDGEPIYTGFTDIGALVDYAITVFNLGQFTKAFEAVQWGVKELGPDETALACVVQFGSLLGDRETAYLAAKVLVELSPTNPEYLWVLVACCEARGRMAEARIYANRARRLGR